MEQEGFAPAFTKFKMQAKQIGLEADQACSVRYGPGRYRAVCVVNVLPQGVKAAFAYGFDLRLGCKGAEQAQVGGCDAGDVPGMDADRIAIALAQKRNCGDGCTETGEPPRGPEVDGIEVDEGVAAQDVGVCIEFHSLSGDWVIA